MFYILNIPNQRSCGDERTRGTCRGTQTIKRTRPHSSVTLVIIACFWIDPDLNKQLINNLNKCMMTLSGFFLLWPLDKNEGKKTSALLNNCLFTPDSFTYSDLFFFTGHKHTYIMPLISINTSFPIEV